MPTKRKTRARFGRRSIRHPLKRSDPLGLARAERQAHLGEMVATIRPPAVAGLFYPGEASALEREVDGLLATARANAGAAPAPLASPKAIIAPHAGYVYSGPVAAHAYAAL